MTREEQGKEKIPPIMENKGRWLILDGLHRLVKAHMQGLKKVQVRVIPRERIPEILR